MTKPKEENKFDGIYFNDVLVFSIQPDDSLIKIISKIMEEFCHYDLQYRSYESLKEIYCQIFDMVLEHTTKKWVTFDTKVQKAKYTRFVSDYYKKYKKYIPRNRDKMIRFFYDFILKSDGLNQQFRRSK